MPYRPVTLSALVFLLIVAPLLAWQMRAPAVNDHRQEILERLLLEQLADQPDVWAAAEKRAAEFADGQFMTKFNAHADAMNAIKSDRENHIANVRHFAEAEHTWNKFHDDPGYLKRDKHPK